MTGQSFKRLVICCDGTWNELDFAKRPVTNVVKLGPEMMWRGVTRRESCGVWV